MIRNANGTPYCLSGEIAFFDPESPDNNLFNCWDQELIRQIGTPIFYYEVFIQPQTVDPLYIEDRGKLWSPIPIRLFGYYEPIPNQNAQGAFGIDAPDEMVFEFNYKQVLQAVGHPPLVGSRLFTPHKREHWVIKQRNDGEFKAWGQLRLQLICQKFQESLTTGEGRVTQAQPDFKINEGPFLKPSNCETTPPSTVGR
jgi:hypothetical protein